MDWVERDKHWGCEHPVQMAIYKTKSLQRKLGFTHQPDLEAWSVDGTCRYDLVSYQDRIVAEVKYKAQAGDLKQSTATSMF